VAVVVTLVIMKVGQLGCGRAFPGAFKFLTMVLLILAPLSVQQQIVCAEIEGYHGHGVGIFFGAGHPHYVQVAHSECRISVAKTLGDSELCC